MRLPYWPALTALALSGGCDLPMPLEPTDGPMLGVWTLTSHLTRDSIPSTCDGTSTLTITEQSPDGALSWTLDQVMTCAPAESWLHGRHYYHDGWENTAWAIAWSNNIRIQTPDPWLTPGCRYVGTMEDDSFTRMTGLVTCQPGGTSTLSEYRGTWEAVRQ
ncbi:MAG: hypothetical protein H6R40_354 [Gemmatimonadetes bacterium]|nr:hypothetical protein [Gemmatimonadota bacterium]